MSRKKSVKKKEKMSATPQTEIINEALNSISEGEKTTPPVKNETATTKTEPTTTPPAVIIPESPEEKLKKLANAIFHNFMCKELNITQSFENEHLAIIVYTFGSLFDDSSPIAPDDIVCYEISSKSNPGVVLFLDEEEISLSLNDHKVAATYDELAFAAANVVGYVKKYYTKNAA